jgi:hemerythrin-like domain-containing protein
MTTTPTPPEDAPIRSFADCHAGIVSHLDDLGRLPALLEPARQARHIAADMLEFFRAVIVEHHADEERELFPAVLASARKGEEHDQLHPIIVRLTREHRQVEAAWSALEPVLKAVAKGADAELDAAAVAALVGAYKAHAHYEEEVFLPLSQQILGRDSRHMAALGTSLHLRRAVPEMLAKRGFRI